MERSEAAAQEAQMKLYFVTFGVSSILGGYHMAFEARDEDIVRRYMVKKVCAPWSNIYTEEPKDSKRLQPNPLKLHYQDWRHV